MARTQHIPRLQDRCREAAASHQRLSLRSHRDELEITISFAFQGYPGEYWVDFFMTPSSQRLESPGNPGRLSLSRLGSRMKARLQNAILGYQPLCD